MSNRRFSQLTVGDSFTFQGSRYHKVSPLLAESDRDGKRRMIPRSALVECNDGGETASPSHPEMGDRLDSALELYHRELNDWLTAELGGTLEPQVLQRLLGGVDRAHQALRGRLAQLNEKES